MERPPTKSELIGPSTDRLRYRLGSGLRLTDKAKKAPVCCALVLPDPAQGTLAYGKTGWLRQFPRAEWSERVGSETITCAEVPGHERGGDRTTALDIVLPSPEIGDLLWTWLGECIISDKVLALFNAAQLAGFEVRPVTVSRIKTSTEGSTPEIAPLWELVVTGRGGDAAPASGIRLLYECDACGMKRYSSFTDGIVVDEDQWDGSDFFTVNGYPRIILVNQRVADLVMENKLTNCALIPSEELRWGNERRPEETTYD